MAIRFYDEALVNKISKWCPSDKSIRILKPEEVTRLFQIKIDESKDESLTLPLIAISRDPEVSAQNNIWAKRPMTFDGFMMDATEKSTKQLNAIGIVLSYQIDIFTADYETGDEYLRNFMFNLINYNELKVIVPYNGSNYIQTSHIKLLNPVSDTSDIPQRLFPGQFTRWTIKIEIDDAFLYSVPVVNNVKVGEVQLELTDSTLKNKDIESI